MLALQAGPQAEGHAAAAAKGEILTGPAPGIRNKALFGDFVVCQVKVAYASINANVADHVVARFSLAKPKRYSQITQEFNS